MKRFQSFRKAIVLLICILVLLACGTSSPEAADPTQAPAATETLEPTATSEPSPTPTNTPVTAFTTKNVNCRSGTSTDYPIVTTVSTGAELVVLGRSAGSDYFYVQNPQDESDGCWVWGELVVVNFEIEILPFFTPPPVPTMAVIPATAAPACEANGSVSIKNDTGGQVTLYLAGPYKFTFYIAAGSQTISICPGSYSYTAYGCGGASRTGTVSDGEEIEFWCE